MVAKKQLEDETIRRVDLENRIQSLKEELAFRDQVHRQVQLPHDRSVSSIPPPLEGVRKPQRVWENPHFANVGPVYTAVIVPYICFCGRLIFHPSHWWMPLSLHMIAL